MNVSASIVYIVRNAVENYLQACSEAGQFVHNINTTLELEHVGFMEENEKATNIMSTIRDLAFFIFKKKVTCTTTLNRNGIKFVFYRIVNRLYEGRCCSLI